VAKSGMESHARVVRNALDLIRYHPEWTLPSKLADNPLAWMILVNGVPMDVRDAPPEIQAEAVRLGIVPPLPSGETPSDGPFEFLFDLDVDASEDLDVPEQFASALAAARSLVEQATAANPGASIDELNELLGTVMGEYNARPQESLGGLSPESMGRLVDADWNDDAGPIGLDETLSLVDLAASRTLDDARLVLTMLGERGTVKATPKGNLPRVFVAEFHERMRPRPTTRDEWLPGSARNEDDLFALRLARALLELTGLVKRRHGVISRTRRGEQWSASDRAGVLYAAIFRTHFRKLDLAFLDGASSAPLLQHTVATTLYLLRAAGREWKSPAELLPLVVLPGVLAALPTHPLFDQGALMLGTRVLRPLEGFGLLEAREFPRAPEEIAARIEFRTTPLYDRFLRFDVATDG
jgi:hypothetical protein